MSVLSETSNRHIMAVKFVIAGGFGVGKTTFVGAISEVEPLTTEAAMTVVATGVDDHNAVAQTTKLTTTVAMDFGRLTVDESLVMYLFGAPGQGRFTFMWDDLINGALGAVVLVDTRRVEDCFAAVDYFEKKELPFVVGVNCFDGAAHYCRQFDLLLAEFQFVAGDPAHVQQVVHQPHHLAQLALHHEPSLLDGHAVVVR